jgi:uncharacterized protein YbjT (DUF2867 family)
MPKRVFVTGGAGFVGASVLRELQSRGHAVHALVNRRDLPAGQGITPIRGDLFDPAALDRGLAGCDAVIHLVGIIAERPRHGITFDHIHVEGTQAVIEAARRAGVRRLVHMSALGTRPNAPSHYHRTKHHAETLVTQSGLDWTILRPSMIHGPRGDLLRMAARWARRQAAPYLFMPYFGPGVLGRGRPAKLQPVHVDDVARAFADTLDNPKTIGQTYPLAGSQTLTWPEFLCTTAQAIVGKPRLTFAIPAWYARLLTQITPRAWLPFNRDQVLMSQEDNTADMTEFVRDFAWTPGAFSDQICHYAKEL